MSWDVLEKNMDDLLRQGRPRYTLPVVLASAVEESVIVLLSKTSEEAVSVGFTQ